MIYLWLINYLTFCGVLISHWLQIGESAIKPLSPNSDQQQFSPNDIHTLSIDKFMRTNKMITKEKKLLWSFIKFSQLILKGNVWRSVWRICTWILGLKGLRWWVINWLYMIWDWVFTLNLINTLNLFLLKILIDHIFELIRSLFALESWLQYTILNVWYYPSLIFHT